MGVFLFDLRRTTRRGRLALIRGGYGLALLVALGGTFPGPSSGFGPADLARLAEQFTAAFLVVQLGAVFLLTPAYAAGAVAEERQRRTLDDLLVTDLSSGAIVLGKLAARWLHVAAALFTGLPVLSLMLCWGGVDPLRLAAGFIVAALTALSLAALGLFYSVRARTVSGAVAATYLAAALFCTFTSCVPLAWLVNPILTLSQLLGGWDNNALTPAMLAAFVLSQLMLTGMLTGSAVLRLRAGDGGPGVEGRPLIRPDRMTRPGIPPAGRLPSPWAALLSPSVALGQPAPLPPAAVERTAPPPIDGDPLLWKEEHFGGGMPVRKFLAAAGCFVIVGLGWALAPLLAVVLYVSLLIGVTIAAAGSISRERERQTLDGLLVLPGGREAVLWAKWLGSIQRVRGRAFALLILLAFSGITGSLHGLALPLLVFTGASHVGFFASLGIYISVVARNTARAGLAAALCLLGLSLFPPLVGCGLSPPVAWGLLTLPASELEPAAFGVTLFGIAAYAAAGRLLWWRASERFRREADGECRP
jgi:ABC-type transport system involved in multi-copper enzyme maturation permease subunit